ncbi:MAG: MFS transporter [Gammaproteobacteria bacterium]|nr:MFS transporter [Gammaproteobacteria bacterium]
MPAIAGTSEDLSHDVIDRGGVTTQQMLVVALCLFFNMLDGFDITAMAVVAGAVSSDLALTPDRLGWIFSFALAGMMGGAMFLAPVSDIIGRRKMIILSIALVGISIIFTATATTLTEFMILRFISGLGAGAMLASQAALASEYSPDRYKAAAVAAVTSGYPLGAMMTSVIAGYILPDYGWRGMFWFGGVLTLAMVVVAWLFIPESLKYLFQRRPADALERINRILTKLRKPTLDEMPQVAEDHTPHYGFIGGMKRLLHEDQRVKTLTLWTAFVLCFSTLYFLMSWIPALMEHSGFDPAAGRRAFFLFNLGGVIGIYVMAYLSTKFRLTNVIFFLSVTAAVCMVGFAIAPTELDLLLGLTLVIGIVQQGGFTGLYSTAAKAYPTRIRTTGIGWCIGLGRVGAVAGPAIAGYLIAAGLDMSANYVIFAIPMAIGGYIAYRLHID